MAGAGFRSWADEEPLYAADLMAYLMEQSVMVFASTTIRDSEIPVPTEGMLSYTKDDNVIRYFDGTLWNAIGEITGGSGISASESTSSITLSLDVDAKGDILVGTANDTVTKLAVGSDGQLLIADSTTTAGVKWDNGFSYSSPLTTVTKSADFTLSSADAGKLFWIDTTAADVVITVPDRTADTGIADGMQWMFTILQGTNDVVFTNSGSAGAGSKSGYTRMTGFGASATALLFSGDIGGSPFDFYFLIGDMG